MILADWEIKKAIKDGRLIIKPFPEDSQYAPSAVDLRLGDLLFEWREDLVRKKGIEVTIDLIHLHFPDIRSYFNQIVLKEGEEYILKPNKFILASTYEKIGFPLEGQLAGRIEGRSSLARLGITAHITAPTIHCGFGGKEGRIITLEIVNLGPFSVKLLPRKTVICQLIVEQVSGKPQRELISPFATQRTPVG